MIDGSYAASYNLNFRNPAVAFGKPRIVLVGTAHVSDKSVAEVNEVIDRERPDIVAVELCRGRYKALKGEDEVKEVNVKEFLSGGKSYYFLLHWLLAYVQKKIGADTGVKPGAEMLSAIEKAEKTGARVALIDRDIQVTLGRFWNRMSFFEKLKLFGSLFGATLGFGTKDIDIDTVTNEDVVTQLISELRMMAPSAASVLLDERNAIMAKNLLDVSHEGTIVAVVGAGHREGIQKYLDHPETVPPIEELMTLPKKRFSWLKVTAIAFIAMVVGLLALLIYSGGVSLSVLLTALLFLFITQGILSAIGVLVAGGHPISALTALSLAWFGFLHPFLAVGWLAGIVEANFRPPTADDIKAIMKFETFLFTWEDVPGTDNDKLISFLSKSVGAEWVKNAKIEKLNEGRMITISGGRNSYSFAIDRGNNKVILKIDNGRTIELNAKIEDGKTGIYAEQAFKELMKNKFFRILLVAGFANVGSMIGTFVAIPLMVHYLGITDPLEILKTALETGFSAIRTIF